MLTFGDQQNVDPRPGIRQTSDGESTEEPPGGGAEARVEGLYEARHGGGVGEESEEVEGVHEGSAGKVETHHHEHQTDDSNTLGVGGWRSDCC